MKMKDFLKIKEQNPKTLREFSEDKMKELKLKSRYPQTKDNEGNDGTEYDEYENFYKRDSAENEYVRDLDTADKIYAECGFQKSKESEKFFNVFPKVDMEQKDLVKEMIQYSYDECKAIIIENGKNDYTLINHDKYGKKYENNIVYDTEWRRMVIEANDPEAYNVVQNIRKEDRYKHQNRSQELRFILEFASMTGQQCFIKYGNLGLMRI